MILYLPLSRRKRDKYRERLPMLHTEHDAQTLYAHKTTIMLLHIYHIFLFYSVFSSRNLGRSVKFDERNKHEIKMKKLQQQQREYTSVHRRIRVVSEL